jgi:thiamine-phosphate pyrophosphorylase
VQNAACVKFPPDCAIIGTAMASRPKQEASRARLMLVTPAVGAPDPLADALARAQSAADVAAVVARLADADERTLIERAKVLGEVVQPAGAALLIDGHADLVARAGADGAHLTGIDALKAAIGTLKPARIAGCGGLNSRHDAMLAAEAGVDYVMFGEPDEAGRRPAFAAVEERVMWWAEVFEVPCVAFAGDCSEAERLALAGADFVALGAWVFKDARGPAATVAEAAQRIAATEPA